MGVMRARGKVYKPVSEINLGKDSDEVYTRANVKAPRVAGFLVKLFVWILESRIFGPIALYILKKDNLIHKFVSLAEIAEPPLFSPIHSTKGYTEQEVNRVELDLTPIERLAEVIKCLPQSSETKLEDKIINLRRWTIRDYSQAYNSRATTPLEVAKRFLASVKDSMSPNLQMAFFINYDEADILRQAMESSLRYEQGSPISILDGILVAVKDELDCMPYPTTGGTKWLHKVRPCTEDADCVKQLRSCGAILVGKTNMHELGAGTSGINPHYGASRNPYDKNRISGGSSSGSAAVVSAGLCPIALGVDGGGSVRMPAALCGVVGFKPTAARVSHSGVLPLNWTVGMTGILTATVEDTLIAYAAICNPLPLNQPEFFQPELTFPLLKSSPSLSNIKFAKYPKWFNDCTYDIKICCDKALDMLCRNYGWKTVEVTLPEIEEMRLAHYVTIGSECTASLGPHLSRLNYSEVGWDARIGLSVYGAMDSKEYLNAQRIRNRQMQFHSEIFSTADVIVTPTTGVTACPLLERIVCEDLPKDLCAFAVSSSSKRCVLESFQQQNGMPTQYQCGTSEVVVETMRDHVESDQCIEACGVDRSSVGISSDSLLEPRFVAKLCSKRCYQNCPNIVDLYFNLAAGEGVFLPDLCVAQRSGPRRALVELMSAGVAVAPAAAVKAGQLDASSAPAPAPMFAF